LPASLIPKLSYRSHGSHHHPLGIDSTGGLGDDSHHRLSIQLLGCNGTRDHNRRGAVIHARSVTGGHRSVFLEGGLKRPETLDGGVRSRRLIFVEDNRRAALLLCRDFYRHNLRLEPAFVDRGDRFPVRVERELILLFSSNSVFFSDVLAGNSHVVIVVDVPKT